MSPARSRPIRSALSLKAIGMNCTTLPRRSFGDPARIRSKEGRGLRVFTPFWKRVQALGTPPEPLPMPKAFRPGLGIGGDKLEDWHLEPARPDWAGGLRETWTPGEKSAQARLGTFLKTGLGGYSEDRDRPDRAGTSGLSPHLRFGEISPRQIWSAARFAADERPAVSGDMENSSANSAGASSAAICCSTYPTLPSAICSPGFDAFPLQRNDKALTAWQRGRTGYPIVDAGMRELWQPASCTTGCGWLRPPSS